MNRKTPEKIFTTMLVYLGKSKVVLNCRKSFKDVISIRAHYSAHNATEDSSTKQGADNNTALPV